MKFNIILEELLNEAMSSIEIHKKFYWDIPYKIYDLIVRADPQTKVNGKEIVKVGRFSKLLLIMYRNEELLMEDLPKATEYLGYVYKYNVPININKITNLGVLYDMIQKHVVQEGSDFIKILEVLPKNEYKILHNGPEWWIFTPITQRAASYLGVNSQWCTTWGPTCLNKSYRDRQSYYPKFKKSPLYIIVNKQNPDTKYQFDFITKQYMDLNDRQIDTGEFFNNTPEIKNFFFPSFINKDYEDVEGEYNKINILSLNDATELIKITTEEQSQQNPLINAILTNNEDILSQLIIDEHLNKYEATEVVKNYLRLPINVNNLYGEIDDVIHEINSYENSISRSYDDIFSDIEDSYRSGEDEFNEKNLGELFEQYYNVNKDKIKRTFGIIEYNVFKRNFFTNFIENDKISEEYFERVTKLSQPDYEEYFNKKIDGIKIYIKINDNYTEKNVSISIPYLIRYLIYREDVTKIENDLNEFINDYLSYYDLGGEPEYYYESNYTYPDYDVDHEMTYVIDEFFDDIFDKSDIYNECSVYRDKFNEIKKNLFKGDTVYENEHVRVEIMSTDVDCEMGTVRIKFHNKDTNKNFEGNVKVENLASYATNYQLFETFARFKKNIL